MFKASLDTDKPGGSPSGIQSGDGLCSAHISIFQCNVTSLRDSTIAYLLHMQYDVVLVQEHRLRGNAFMRAKRMLSYKYQIYGTAACIKYKAATGGARVLILKGFCTIHRTIAPS